MLPALNTATSPLDLPNELISYILALAVLAPPFLSPHYPTAQFTTLSSSRPRFIETRTPAPETFTIILLISHKLTQIAKRTPQLTASLSLAIPLLPNIGRAPPPGQRPPNPFQARFPYIHAAFKRARGGVLPLRLYLTATFPCPKSYDDANNPPLGLAAAAYARTAGWMRGDLAYLTMPLFRDLVCNEGRKERWEVLDLTLPKYFCFERILESLTQASGFHAYPCRFERLKKLALVCTHADKDGEPSRAANGFLHSFKRNAPLLEDVTLILKTTLAPALPPLPPTSGTLTSTSGQSETQRNTPVLTRYPNQVEIAHINASARESLRYHATRTSASLPLKLSLSAQRMWPTLKRLTLDTYTTSMQLVYLLAQTPALEKLDVVMSGDDTAVATATTANADPPSIQDPQKIQKKISEQPRIVLTRLKTLVLRSSSKLEILHYMSAPQLLGLYVQMILDANADLASEKASRALVGFLKACTSPDASSEAHDEKMDVDGAHCQPKPKHPLKHLKLVSFPLSDASILRVLSATPDLKELRMWWVGDARGAWVEGLMSGPVPFRTSMAISVGDCASKMVPLVPELKSEREFDLVPGLRYVEVHVSPGVVRDAERAQVNEGRHGEEKKDGYKMPTPSGPPEIVRRMWEVVEARNAVYRKQVQNTHLVASQAVPGPLTAMVKVSGKLYPCEGCGSRISSPGNGKWDWERAGVEVGDEWV